MALTDKLIAIADAIRGKTGGTEGMTLDAMVSAIEGISGGGGVPYATGSFTAVELATITHNLNSTKVFVAWSVRDNPAVYTRRYKAVMGYAISNGVYPTRVVDFSPYTTNSSGITELVAGADYATNYNQFAVISPYVSDNYLYSGNKKTVETDPNTFSLAGGEGFLASLTYDWVAVDVSGILPWAEEGVE